MLYTTKKLYLETDTMNNAISKQERKELVEQLDGHISRGDMVVYQDEATFDLYLSGPSQGNNLCVQGGVSTFTGLVLIRTHEDSITKLENARFIADLFVAAQRTTEYRELPSANKVVIVTDNAHDGVEDLARQLLVNGNRLVILKLGPHSPMLNPMQGCLKVLKTEMRDVLAAKKQELLAQEAPYRVAIMKEAVAEAAPAITRRLVWQFEYHAAKASFMARRGEDVPLDHWDDCLGNGVTVILKVQPCREH